MRNEIPLPENDGIRRRVQSEGFVREKLLQNL